MTVGRCMSAWRSELPGKVAGRTGRPVVFAVLRSGGPACYGAGMNTHELLKRIAPEAGKMGGKPVIRGRRITPAMVLNMLANGASREAVLVAYPVLEPADIDACLLYAARLSDVAAERGLTIAAE